MNSEHGLRLLTPPAPETSNFSSSCFSTGTSDIQTQMKSTATRRLQCHIWHGIAKPMQPSSGIVHVQTTFLGPAAVWVSQRLVYSVWQTSHGRNVCQTGPGIKSGISFGNCLLKNNLCNEDRGCPSAVRQPSAALKLAKDLRQCAQCHSSSKT